MGLVNYQQGQAQGGLLEQPWEGGNFVVEFKYVWPGDRALHAASKGGSPEMVLGLLLRGRTSTQGASMGWMH